MYYNSRLTVLGNTESVKSCLKKTRTELVGMITGFCLAEGPAEVLTQGWKT